jgi:hypothetical protein
MNLSEAWKKVLLFGLFGAAGCLAGWLAGEPYLAVAQLVGKELGAAQGGTLISKPVAPPNQAPPPPREFQERLSEAKAKTGDVQISLIWDDANDLDLHCVDPDGFEICWRPGQRRSPRTGGELDVDRNAGCRSISARPVENIYWAKDTAKPGKYRIYLNFYQQCVNGPVESEAKISVLHGSVREDLPPRRIRKDIGGEGPMVLVHELDLRPKLEILAASEFVLAPGGTLKLPVVLGRTFVPGKVDVKVEGLPGGVTVEPLSISRHTSEGELVFKATAGADTGKVKIKLVATAEDVTGTFEPQLTVGYAEQFSLFMLLAIGLWTALLATGLCLALLGGQNRYLGKSLFAPGRIPLPLVVVGAVGAGFASGTLGQALAYVFAAIGAKGLGFLIGWILLGGLLGFGVSFFIPNLDRKKASLAGLAGGFLGALAFLVMSLAADFVGRFFGAAILGFCIGLMVAVVEVAFRRAWLEVRFSEREVITVNLGPEPVKVGGEARLCTVWARGAADVALKYWIRDGKVYCEDVPGKREAVVGDGDTRPAGNVTVVVRTGNTPAPAAASRPNPPAPPVRPAAPVPPPVPAAVPVAWPPPPAVTKPSAPPKPPAPAPKSPEPPPTLDYDDGMPMPMSPPPPPVRTGTRSILDIDELLAAGPPRPPVAPAPKPPAPPAKPQAAAPPVPKPAAPAPAKPPGAPSPASSVSAVPPKPPAPPAPARSIAPPAPKPPGAPVIAAKPGEDSCPTCGRKIKGDAGARYCMVCDKTF